MYRSVEQAIEDLIKDYIDEHSDIRLLDERLSTLEEKVEDRISRLEDRVEKLEATYVMLTLAVKSYVEKLVCTALQDYLNKMKEVKSEKC